MTDVPKKKRNIWPWLVGGFVVLAIAGAPDDKGKKQASGQPASSDASPAVFPEKIDRQAAPGKAPPTIVTPGELEKAYKANEVAAQQSFGDRELRVRGMVAKIQLDMMNNPQVIFAGSDFDATMASFEKADSAKLAKLRAGDTITIDCGKVGEVLSRPVLTDCSLASS